MSRPEVLLLHFRTPPPMISIVMLEHVGQSWETHVAPVQDKRRAFRWWQLNHLASHVLHCLLKTLSSFTLIVSLKRAPGPSFRNTPRLATSSASST